MLKPALTLCASSRARQPPSGGCVLKLDIDRLDTGFSLPAAFRRLCVETENDGEHVVVLPPAAFRRLCVETIGGKNESTASHASRLRAAVC